MAGDRGRLLADENFPEPVSRQLRLLGYDIDRVRRHGQDKWASRISDGVVQEIARNFGRNILTQDKDFRDSLKLIPGHRGVVWCASTLDFSALAQKIDAFLKKNRRTVKGRLAIIPLEGEGHFADEPTSGKAGRSAD